MSITRAGGIFHNTISTIIRLQANGKLDPAEVLEMLLSEFISANTRRTSVFYDVKQEPVYLLFAKKCLGWLYPDKYPQYFRLDLANPAITRLNANAAVPVRNPDDPMSWFILHLNDYVRRQRIPDHVSDLLEAYFSVYELYRSYLESRFLNQRIMFDVWNDRLDTELHALRGRELVQPAMVWSRQAWIPPESRMRLLSAVMVLYEDEYHFSLKYYFELNHGRYSPVIVNFTRQMKRWMSDEQCAVIAASLFSQLNHQNRHRALFACELMPEFSAWLQPGVLNEELLKLIARLRGGNLPGQLHLTLLEKLAHLLPVIPVDMHDGCVALLLDSTDSEVVEVNCKALDLLARLQSSMTGDQVELLLTCINRNIQHNDPEVRIHACQLLQDIFRLLPVNNVSLLTAVLWDMMTDKALPVNLRSASIVTLSDLIVILPSEMLTDFDAVLLSMMDDDAAESAYVRSAVLHAVGQVYCRINQLLRDKWMSRLCAFINNSEIEVSLRIQAVKSLEKISRGLTSEQRDELHRQLISALVVNKGSSVVTVEILTVLNRISRRLAAPELSELVNHFINNHLNLSTADISHCMQALALLVQMNVPERERIIRFFIERLENGLPEVSSAVRSALDTCLLHLSQFEMLAVMSVLTITKRDEDTLLFSRVYHAYRDDMQMRLLMQVGSSNEEHLDAPVCEKIIRMN